MVIFQPTYFSPIIQYVEIIKCDNLTFEVEDNFQKQTYRNRCYIATSNGKLLLNVPIIQTKGIKQKTKDVKIDYKDDWNTLHLKSLETAYSSSPFFEFYIDELKPVFQKKFTYLLDLNFACHKFIMNSLQLNIPYSKSIEYQKEGNFKDERILVNAKGNKSYDLSRYIQVFEQTQGFISNLSILDLLFMEGPNALNYLENQQIQS